MKRKDFQGLASLRLKEARVLLHARCWEGAYHIGGYAAECALKACISRQTKRHDFPDKERVNASYTHNLADLLGLAGLKNALREAGETDEDLNSNWDIVRNRSERSRYQRRTREEAEALVEALGSRSHGILPWLKRHW